MKKTFNRALSVILAVLMFASVMPMAFAAGPIELTEANVSEWPVANGEIWYGQKISDGITLSGGVVTSDGTSNGTVIPGKFEFVNIDYKPTSGGQTPANLKFVPEDAQNYLGFELEYAWNVLYTVKYVTPVLVDENNPPVATEVEAGARISTSKLSGGAVKNPITNEVIEDAVWKWSSSRTKVNESGYYPAKLSTSSSGYDVLTMDIYVRIAGDTPETEIKINPTVILNYDPNLKWENVEFNGGKAVIKGTSTEVSGSFSVTEKWRNVTPLTTHTEVDVKFTPDDETQALPVEFKLPVTVNAATVKFVDESGNEIVPEITIDRILTVGDDLNGYLKPYLNASCSFNYEETEGYGEKIKSGTHEYTVKTISDDPNYERYSTLTFKIVLNKEKVNAKVKNVVGGKQIYIEGGDTYHLNGNFDVKYFIDGKEAGIIEDVEFNKPFKFVQNESGVYTYEIVYNGTEDDYYDITVITEAEDIKLQHQVKVAGQEPITYTYGEKVTVTAPAHEKPYYEFTGWVNESGITLTDEQRSAESISTTMPDNDIELEATYKFNFSLFIKYIFDVICSWFAKIAAFITGAFAA